MSEPLVTKNGDRGNSSEANATINDRTGLYIAIVAVVLGGIALGVAVTNPKITDAKLDVLSDKATIGENHWRNIETENKVLRNEVDRLSKIVEDMRDANRRK